MPKAEQIYANSQSESFKRLNPHLIKRHDTDTLAGRIQAGEREQIQRRTLDGQEKGDESRPRGPVYRVTLLCFSTGIRDSDNVIAGLKPLRDAIAGWLCIDDNDRFILWEYVPPIQSIQTGVLVKITIL